MNERIKELAEQAGDDWDHTLKEDREFLERFAALVAANERDVCAKTYSEVDLADAYKKGWDDAMLRNSLGEA